MVLLTGKLYYDLEKERAARKLEERVALVRVEELAPFPFRALEGVLRRYLGNGERETDTKVETLWVQEEPRNQGAWTHVKDRIQQVLDRVTASVPRDTNGPDSTPSSSRLRYVGRKEDVVPAVGVGKVYREQQADIVRRAFEGL